MEHYISQNAWLLYAVTVVLGLVVAFFIRKYFNDNIKALQDISGSISDLYDKYNNIEHRLSTIEGEHKVFSTLKHGG